MKVVLFCGGQGLRLRGVYDDLPKPLVEIGGRPILWHIMRYYAYYGHTDFVLCLGHRGEQVRDYFRSRSAESHGWRITFVDTGVDASIGERFYATKDHVGDQDVFLANYADGLSDVALDRLIGTLAAGDKIGLFVSVIPSLSYHFIDTRADGTVIAIREAREANLRINGGYFVFRKEIFEHLRAGEDLMNEPAQRLLRHEALLGYPHDGFWKNMDTFKDKQALDELCASGHAPWEVWKGARGR
jgi:glucose-1-phosphate cytidylyltransferase